MKKNKRMSPLIIVGIVISTALADVSHVLSGSAHPPPNPIDVNSLAGPKSAFQTGNPQDFWWMASNSPLKASYDYYKKCSSKGNCLPPINVVSEGAQITKSANSADANFGPIDVNKNPFLNGNYQSGSVSSSSSFSSSGCNACSSGSKSNGVAAFHSGTKIDITNNPFLNGQIATAGNGDTIKSENGFLGVQPKKPGFATSHPLSNKKPFATSPPFGQQSFVLGGDADKVECRGNGYTCAAKDLCVNGVVNKNGEGLFQVRTDVQYCNANTEVCCRLANGSERPPFDIILPTVSGKGTFASSINDLVDVSAGKSSVTGSTLKFSGGAGSSPGQIQVLLDQSADVKPQVYHVGESGSQYTSNKTKPVRDVTPSANSVFSTTVDYSNVQFPSDVRFASTIRGPAYLPPIGGSPTPPSKIPDLEAPTPSIITYQPSIPTSPRPIQTARSCPPGTFLTPSGICELPRPPAPTPRPCPPGTFLTSSGSCEAPKPVPCPFGTIQRPDGSCVGPTPPSTPPPCPFGTIQKTDGSCERPIPTPKPCPPGTFLTASGLCETPSTPSPSCPYGTIRSPNGICERPTPRPCPPGTFLASSGSCEAPKPVPCPFGTIQKADGSCERPIPTPRPCPPGTFLTASGLCETPNTPTPTCPFGTVQGPYGVCKTPSPPTTIKSCPLGTHLTADGDCIKLEISSTSRPCPPGTFLTDSGKCESPTPTPRPSCPPGTFQVDSGACEYPTVSSTTTGYDYSKPCPPGTFKTPAGLCERPVTTPRPQCPPGTYLTPSGSCETPSRPSTPKPPPRPFETTASREYLPPVTPTQPTTTPRPADGYIYNKPTPTFGYPSSTLIPNSNDVNQVYVPFPTTYLPPPDESREEVRISPRPTTERLTDVTGESINNDYRVVLPATRKPPIYNGEQNEAPPAGCAAALKCVQEIYCTADGFVSPVPVVLTKDQELLKVPTTVCKDEESGIIGKCCRDPNYKDPWPSANLVNGVDDGQYKEDNLYGQRGVGNNRLVRSSNATRSPSRPVRNLYSPRNIQESQPACGQRNHNTNPLGPGPIDANFAEYPWQAMILRDSNRSLLCGGAIIRRNAVLTAAHCVEGLDTSDVLIKGGEWKLGIDEEPLPFQIVKVAAILRHPDYTAGSYENDLAVLVLQEKLRPSKNVGTICLPQPNQIPTSNCIATGWGKRILQLHAKGALMHHINVNVMDGQQCQQTLQQSFQDSVQNYSPNTLCGFSDIDQCKVDYGSALACSDNEGHYTLSGIYAWDTGCKQEGQIGGYVAPDVEWIDFILAKSLKDLKKVEKEYLLKSRV